MEIPDVEAPKTLRFRSHVKRITTAHQHAIFLTFDHALDGDLPFFLSKTELDASRPPPHAPLGTLQSANPPVGKTSSDWTGVMSARR